CELDGRTFSYFGIQVTEDTTSAYVLGLSGSLTNPVSELHRQRKFEREPAGVAHLTARRHVSGPFGRRIGVTHYARALHFGKHKCCGEEDALKLQEVCNQLLTIGCENAFRMELHPLYGIPLVA